MEPLLELEEETIAAYNQESSSSSSGYKLVPWLNWAEWESARKSLFSSSRTKISSALTRISTWRSRGCLPAVIDVTASIIEIQQTDPFFQSNKSKDGLISEEMLAMLYCMAILRLVNCVVEKTRKRTGISIAHAADAIGMPRMLIDVRHEGSHRNLPSLAVLRETSVVALNWLKSYYWEPQKKQIPFQRDGSVSIRREIKLKLRELALCIKLKQSPELASLLPKGKGGRHFKPLCSRSKIFSLMAGKVNSSQFGSPKKQITKSLKSLVSLYSISSSEVASILLEFLLKDLDSSSLMDLQKDSKVDQDKHSSWDNWELVITKFSNKEPELLLALLHRVLDMIGTKEALKYEADNPTLSGVGGEARQVQHLSSLFAWLVRHLLELKPHHAKGSEGKSMSNATVMEVLRKCLLVSAFANDHLMDSALLLAQLVGNNVLIEKLNKLCSLGLSSSTDFTEDMPSLEISKIVCQEQESINQATKTLELIKHRRMKSRFGKTFSDGGTSNRWNVAKSWKPCPLGMLPRALGSSGRIPVLDYDNDNKRDTEPVDAKDNSELNHSSGKRKANDDIQQPDFSSPKKVKLIEDNHELDEEDVSSRETCGHLMIDGLWKKVKETDVQDIASAVRVLV